MNGGVTREAARRPSGDPQVCQGGKGDDSFFGHGQVNALAALK